MRSRTPPLRAASLREPAFEPDEARRVVDEVLSRSEYADLEPGLVDRALAAVAERIAAALSALEGTGAGTALGIAVIVLAVAALGLLVVRFLGGVRRDAGTELAVGGRLGRSPEDWFADADRHEGAGELRQALRCRYRGLVSLLAARGVVDEVAGRTTGEYLAAVRKRAPAAGAPFAAVTARFEAAWYGDEGVSADDLAGVRAREAEVRAAVLRPAASGARP